jgi:hypothetical protein
MVPILAIPTYKRHQTLTNRTLRFLEKAHYPAEKIYLFVADTVEEAIYSSNVPKNLYGKIIVGVKGLAEQRNFITDFFPEDEILIQMDDDIKKIDTPDITFLDLIDHAIKKLNELNSGLFGVMPNDDTRRYADKTTTHLTHIIGCFFVHRNHKDIRITHTEKEDYERSILYFLRYGTVLRYRGGGVSTTYQQGTGGLQESNRKQSQEEGVIHLTTTYPTLCKRKDKKGCPDVTLNWRSK